MRPDKRIGISIPTLGRVAKVVEIRRRGSESMVLRHQAARSRSAGEPDRVVQLLVPFAALALASAAVAPVSAMSSGVYSRQNAAGRQAKASSSSPGTLF
jgi:hypothetical protein